MSLSFKFVPLTFQKDQDEIKRQIRNTVILSHFFARNDQIVPLGNLIEGTQYGFNASALQSGKNKFLRISDITDGKVDWGTVPFCDCQDEETYLLIKDDILIARTGGTTGKSFKIESAPEGAIYAGYLIRIRANENTLPDFLDVFLNSYSYWSQIVSLNEGEFRPSVNANKLKDLLLPVCSPDEQSDIVQLSKGEKVYGYEELTLRIDKAIKEYESSIEIKSLVESQNKVVSQLKQSILQEAIQGKLTKDWRELRQVQQPPLEPASELLKRIQAEKAKLIKEKKIKNEKLLPPITESEKPYELPEGWEWCRLGELGDTQTGTTPPKTDPSNYDSFIPFIQPGNISSEGLILDCDYLSEKGLELGRLIPAKSNLMVCIGGSAGKTCTNQIPVSCNQQINTVTGFSGVDYKYLDSCLKSPLFQNSVWSKIKQGSTPILNKGKWSEIPVPLCSESEQKAIVEKVESLMERCQALEEEISQSEQHAQMLMQAVLKEAFEN